MTNLNLNLLRSERDPALETAVLAVWQHAFWILWLLLENIRGCGICYKYGMFKQQIRDGYQVEVPDNWLKTAIHSS